ncbi:MAG: methyltransferase domain-containing protein, partial [Anaerolineae bacterium]
MHTFLLDLLVCPTCHHELTWTQVVRDGDRVNSAVAECAGCGASYPVREDIGIFLTPDLPRDDLWEQASGLMRAIQQQPDLQKALLDVPLDSLNPADQFFRGMVLEELGEFDSARDVFNTAMGGLYSQGYRDCWQRQTDELLRQIAEIKDAPILDLASGRGYLVERMLNHMQQPIIASDFSPRVLRRDRRYWQHFGQYDRLSLLCFDARRMPVRDGGINVMTTNLGLPNIENPDLLLRELRRVISGSLFAISHFYPPDDPTNQPALRQAGIEVMLTEN